MITALMLVGALAVQEGARNQGLGQGLLEACEVQGRPMDAALSAAEFVLARECISYIDGVADALQSFGVTCYPAGVTSGQGAAVVLKYLRDHPERLHEHRYILVRAALTRAFPCKAK